MYKSTIWKTEQFKNIGSGQLGLLNSKSQVFTPRSDPVNISIPVETDAVELVEDRSVYSGIQWG